MSDKFKHEAIYRGDYLDRLNSKSILVCGCGALGSNLIDTLCRTGLKTLVVVDKDRIEKQNISTQVWSESEIGQLKTVAIKNRMFRQCGAEIVPIMKELTGDNAKSIISRKGYFDLCIDGFDNAKSRMAVKAHCWTNDIPCIHAGMIDGYGEVCWNQKYRVPSDADGDVCDYPLARNLIMLTVAILAEEVLDFCLSDKPRMKNWSVTLRDLQIREMKL